LDTEIVPQLPKIDHPEWTTLVKTLKRTFSEDKHFSPTKHSTRTYIRNLGRARPLLRPLVILLTKEHFQWQRDTILISFARKDPASQIYHNIDTVQHRTCQLCGNKNHREQLCHITKERMRQKRFKACINARKCNALGPYAQESPFHLLVHTHIPEAVFETYERNSISVSPGNRY